MLNIELSLINITSAFRSSLFSPTNFPRVGRANFFFTFYQKLIFIIIKLVFVRLSKYFNFWRIYIHIDCPLSYPASRKTFSVFDHYVKKPAMPKLKRPGR